MNTAPAIEEAEASVQIVIQTVPITAAFAVPKQSNTENTNWQNHLPCLSILLCMSVKEFGWLSDIWFCSGGWRTRRLVRGRQMYGTEESIRNWHYTYFFNSQFLLCKL
jgi:hypothetical protein